MGKRSGIRVKLLRNHGATVSRRDRWGGLSVRFVPQGGSLTTHETAAALDTNRVQVQRLIARADLKARRGRRGFLIPLSEVRRLLRLRG